MCKAFEDMINEAEKRGEAIGKIIGTLDVLKEVGLSDDEAIKEVAKKYSVTEEYVRNLMYPAE